LVETLVLTQHPHLGEEVLVEVETSHLNHLHLLDLDNLIFHVDFNSKLHLVGLQLREELQSVPFMIEAHDLARVNEQ